MNASRTAERKGSIEEGWEGKGEEGENGVVKIWTLLAFFLYIDSPQQGDLRLLGPPSSRSASGGARAHDRRVPADLRADSLATVPPTPPPLLALKYYTISIT
ncbi:hypothetical protein PoB_006605100 [Plakobranchus ocellatus]|uniref:Uncharacterized protein n=1 Tax=Plakobranchus ocellatus TaxID=259542 RepID=A0AAV4D660_9GAST|nr:hypothetical protein PoB_006605100 [Plakobranchus ocellatus]